MKHKTIQALVFMTCLVSFGFSQDETSIKVVQLTDKLYKIELYAGFDANLVASIGEDGLLLVDTGFKATAAGLQTELRKLHDAGPVYIITTHEHIDHTGGNAIFGDDPVIIGHQMLRMRMRADKYILEEYPEEALPEITFTDSLMLFFNWEKIRILSIAGSHTDNDIMVHFTKSGYAYLGDIAYGLHIPSVDLTSGDDSQYAKAVQKALDLLPVDTKFVSGHGRDLNMSEMREFHQMLEETIETVRREMEKGKDVATMQKEKILNRWEKYAEGGYTSTDTWIQNIVDGFNQVKVRATPQALFYRAFQEGGIDSVIAVSRDLREHHAEEYPFFPYQLYKFAYYLINKNKYGDAIQFLEYDISEYPDSYFLYDGLGEAYWKNGEKEKAVQHYEKSLDLEPENSNAIRILELIKKK